MCKSITGDTEILIIENEKSKVVKIGEWVDKYMENKEKIRNYEEQLNSEIMDIENVFIPTGDNKGNTKWANVKSIVRHDPEELMYKIGTKSGRIIKVVESKSLIVYNDNTNLFEPRLTSEIKLGNYLPVTAVLSKPFIKTLVDMEKYFPKTEYIYGTELNKAIELLKIDKDVNWWNRNNNISFTLPYTTKSGLLRCKNKNKVPLKTGCIYPYIGHRNSEITFYDKFELNYNNGLFLGLYLAEGSIDIKLSSIRIANNDPNIRNFVKEWFSNMEINCEENTNRKFKKEGTEHWQSCEVRGWSLLLAKFLSLFAGYLSNGKYIPDEVFNAPDEFIIGLLNGYWSGDGNISGNTITIGSVSKKLLDGISMLCSRFGIFGKIIKKEQKVREDKNIINIQPYIYEYSIGGAWSKIFAEKVPMLHKGKQEKLNHIIQFGKVKEHINYKVQNDVVLDEIVSIEKIDSNDYLKVYDVSVPDTENFMIFNGLIIKNTAEVY